MRSGGAVGVTATFAEKGGVGGSVALLFVVVNSLDAEVTGRRIGHLQLYEVARTGTRYGLVVSLVVVKQVRREVAVLAGRHGPAKDLLYEGPRHTARSGLHFPIDR